MNTKIYKKPIVEIILPGPTRIIAVSGSTGATGEDIPWGVKAGNAIDEDIWNDNDEEL